MTAYPFCLGGDGNVGPKDEDAEVLYKRQPEYQAVSVPTLDLNGSTSSDANFDGSDDESDEVDVLANGDLSSSDDEEEEEEIGIGDQWSSIYYSSLAAPDSSEATFYEQSCRQYFTQAENEEKETNQREMLQTGLQLSDSYLFQFEDKHPSVQNRDPFYPEMLNEVALKDRLLKQPDMFKRGILQIESSHVAKCLPIESLDNANAIQISGRSKANQAYNDDEVVVELLDAESDHNEQRFGRVIGVLKRNRHKDIEHPVFICTIDDMESHLVRPMCKTVPKIHILNKQVTEKYKNEKRYKIEFYRYDEQSGTLKTERNSVRDINPGDRDKYVFLVVLIKWSRQHVYPIGAIIDILPSGNTIENGLTILNLQHQIPALYTEKTVRRVESVHRRQSDEPSEAELLNRTDFTSLNTFTIDPAGSLDLDDALSIEPSDGDYKVGVHIADVSAYVKRNDQVDEEARERATTFYPGIRRPRHMLPEPLSTNICSLLPNKVRLTISVFFFIGANGKPLQMEGNNFEIKLSYIKSRQQFTYAEVQRIIESDECEHPCSRDVKALFKLAKAVRKLRLGNAMFAMGIEEEEEDLEEDQALEAHYLVEEFMIMANRKVAEVLTRKFPSCVPLRCQKAPPQEDIENFTRKHGVYINSLLCLQDRVIGGYLKPNLEDVIQSQNGKDIIIGRKTWARITGNNEASGSYVKTDAIHPLQYLTHSHWMSIQEHALYRCSGSLKGSKDGRHFSLDIYPYTHFTSPIRRYCDLLIHRLLKALLQSKAAPYQKKEVENICAHLNSRMARAKEYQKGCRVLQQAVQLKENQRMVTCFIEDVSDRGFSFRAPSLPSISQREIPFSLLGVGFKPDLVADLDGGYDKVTTTWIMRLYNFYKKATNERDGGRTLTVSPYQVMAFLPIARWCRILKSLIEGRLNDFKRYVKTSQPEYKTEGQTDVTTECKDVALMQPNTKFCMSFTHGQIVSVQITAVPRKGVLTPCPMLYNMTDNVKFCLLHRDDPVLYLSHYTTNPTFEHYKSVQIYLQRWLPLIEMEAAIGAVSNEESCVIKDVPIKFKNANTGKFLLPTTECEERNIEFSGTESEENNFNDPGCSYDWLCLRCGLRRTNGQETQRVRAVLEQDSFWVGHAQIQTVKKRNHEMAISFQLHDRSPPLPMHVRLSQKFQVEILRKSEVDR